MSKRPTAAPLLSERDQAVVELIGKFKQMTHSQIRMSLFSELASLTPVDRTLKRLLAQGYLSRLRRPVGGDGGGSGQYIYQLGRAGWKLLDRPGHFWAPRAVNLHTLAIADCYGAFRQAEDRGELEIIEFTTEPICHQNVGPIRLTPDAYAEVGRRARCLKHTLWLEVDRGSEHRSTLGEKCSRYWHAFQCWRDEFYPQVTFVVPDLPRKLVVEEVIAHGPADATALFKVLLAREVGDYFAGVAR